MGYPGERSIEDLSEELSVPLSRAVTRWYESEDHSKEAWQNMLMRVLEDPLTTDLLEPWSNSLKRRKIKPRSPQYATLAVLRTIRNTDDIRKRILNAPLVAASSPFHVRTLLHSIHQKLVASSLIQRARDIFLRGSVEKDPRLTGNARWITNSENSRHADLAERVFNIKRGIEYKGETIFGPRDDVHDVNEWSGCLCNLEFETMEGEWV